MKNIFSNFYLKYAFILIAGALILYLRNKIAFSPWFLDLGLIFFVFVPGYLLSKMINLGFSGEVTGSLILYLSLGLIFNFLLNFGAILTNLSLQGLSFVYIIALFLIFLGAILMEYRQREKAVSRVELDWRKYFHGEYWPLVILGVYTFLILMLVTHLGAGFKGDPIYHLAIVEKVIGGNGLSAENLAFVKNQIPPAYGLPIWPVALGLLTHFFHTNMFTLYGEIPAFLTGLVILVWYYLFTKIIPNRGVAVLAVIFLLAYKCGDSGYILTRLPVPDTLAQLVFLPLNLALALKYIFDQKANLKLLIIVSLISLIMAAIHLTQFFYYFGTVLVFTVLYAILQFKNTNYKMTLKKMLQVLLGAFLVVLPLLGILQLKSKSLSSNLTEFAKKDPENFGLTFKDYDLFGKLAYLSTPLLFLWSKKKPQLLLLAGLFLIVPIVFNIDSIKVLLVKILSFVFVSRLYGNVTWSFAAWALVIGFIIYLIDWFIFRLTAKNKIILITINIVFVFLTSLFLFKVDAVQFLNNLLSSELDLWLQNYYLLILLPLIALVLFLYFFLKKTNLVWQVDNFKNPLIAFLLILVAGFTLISPLNPALAKAWQKEKIRNRFLSPALDGSTQVFDYSYFGGKATIDFIQQNIPEKSIFDASSGYLYLPLLVDQYMSAYPYKQYPEYEYSYLYLPDFSLQNKLQCIDRGKIEYLMIITGDNTQTVFDSAPQYFTNIYRGGAAIYKVNLNQVQSDLEGVPTDPNLVCGRS